MNWIMRGLWVVSVWLVVASSACAASSDEDELARLYGDAEFISLVTGSRQPVSHAPAAASVITRADIEALGATDLDQILESVPGLHVSYGSAGFNPIYVIRGIYSDFNPQVLVLVNGVPITNLFVGNRGQGWGGMPVHAIERIEVIRGPGSALYGADAFAGTINIITQTAPNTDKFEAGARVGQFSTREVWLQQGGHWGGFQGALSLEWKTTAGYHETVESDGQSVLDAVFGTAASLTPGPVSAGRDTVEARLDIARGDWRVRMGYQGRRNIGTGAGIAQALDPQGQINSDRFNADLIYDKPGIARDWDMTAQLSYFDVSVKSDLVLYPPSVTFPAGVFPDGLIGNPYVYERHTRLSVSALYTGIDRHSLRLGAGYNRGELYKAMESKNFTVGSDGLPVPLGSVVDVSNDPGQAFILPHQRDVVHALLQDEWSFAPDWNLTAGVRHDAYSDVGGTTNPRLALVWQSNFTLTSKLLYGRAFRAPAFAELYNINNPVALGSPDLKPETIDTVELAFDYRPSDTLRSNFNLFRYEMGDIIRFASDPAPAISKTARNQGTQDGYGLEWEMRWNVTRAVDLKANYAWQHSTDETGENVANAPRHKLYAQADWRFLPYWSANVQVNRVMGRERTAGDNRPAIADYTVVNLALRRKNVMDAFDVGLIVHNALDADVREPSPAPGYIRNDLPMPGRGVYVELRYAL